jgi:hypothetical protein
LLGREIAALPFGEGVEGAEGLLGIAISHVRTFKLFEGLYIALDARPQSCSTFVHVGADFEPLPVTRDPYGDAADE